MSGVISIQEIIDKIWVEGKKEGLSDKEILQKIENAVQERTRMQKREAKNKKRYTPMTDEEIRKSQEKINESSGNVSTSQPITSPKVEVQEQVFQMPQLLYAPPTQEIHEVVQMPQPIYAPPTVETHEEVFQMPQLLYAPPTREIHEMFKKTESEDNNKPKKV